MRDEDDCKSKINFKSTLSLYKPLDILLEALTVNRVSIRKLSFCSRLYVENIIHFLFIFILQTLNI